LAFWVNVAFIATIVRGGAGGGGGGVVSVAVALAVATVEADEAGAVGACVAEAEPVFGGPLSPPPPPHAKINTPDAASAPTRPH
jgi:hypothetical protein